MQASRPRSCRRFTTANPKLQAAYEATYLCDAAERLKVMPDLKDARDLEDLIGLHIVHVQPVTKDGVPYIGYEFGCTWDEEHGLGVLMHGETLAEIGGADISSPLWVAQRHANAET